MKSFNESPEFWDDMGDTLFPPERIAAADPEIDALLALLQVDRPLDVLDMPCGVGRHSIALARRGHRVTGVDRTASYLERARRHAADAGLAPDAVRWLAGDMRQFDEPARYDLVVNLWTSFGYGPGRDDDRRAAQAFFSALRPGGRLLMDLAGKEVVVRRLQTHRWHPRADGVIVLEQARAVEDFRRIEQRWITIIPPGVGASPAPAQPPQGMARYVERCGSLRLYSACELADLLEGVGFIDCRAFGSAQGTPYDHEAQRLVLIAQRPA